MKAQKSLLFIILCLLTCVSKLFSQTYYSPEQDLKYTKYYDVVNKWIMIPRTVADTVSETAHQYGFIFIEPNKGFFYQTEGYFDIDEDGRYVLGEPLDISERFKYLISEWAHVDTIPLEKRQELNIPEYPDWWIKFYKKKEDEPSYRIGVASVYNDIALYQKALSFLDGLYEEEPHLDGLELVLSRAYRGIDEYEKTVSILEGAVANKSDDAQLYYELAYALSVLNKADEAEAAYKKSLEITEDKNLKERISMNMAEFYSRKKDKQKFEEWYNVGKKITTKDSMIDKILEVYKKNINKE